MQIGGLDGGHGAGDHHVTKCIHDHGFERKLPGGAAAKASASESASAPLSMLKQDTRLSLSEWLKNMLGSSRSLLRNLWGGSHAGADTGVAAGKQSLLSAGLAQPGDPSTPSAAENASVTVQPRMQFKSIHDNPYFSAIEDTGDQKQTLWQKMKVRFHNVTGQLSGRLPEKFFGFQAKNSFQPKQEKPKEDMRKHSRYREDTLQVDCFLTDDSYLMDSYDRKGEYRTLTTKK